VPSVMSQAPATPGILLRLICSIMSVPPPVLPNVADVAAPLLIGIVWNWALYGILLVQTYVYSYHFTGDRKLLKVIVYSIFFIETLQTALSGADLFYWFADGFGNMDRLKDPYAAAFDVPMIGAVISTIVQFFFAYRVWMLSDKGYRWLCLIIIICTCSIVDAGAAFAGGIHAHITKSFATGDMLEALALTWVIGTAVSDSLITIAMLYHLARHRRTGSWPFSCHALSKVVRLTIETDLLTTAGAIVSLLMIVIFPNKNWYACPTAILGKLYSNTLLVSFNNRVSVRDESSGNGALPKPPESHLPLGVPPSRRCSDILPAELEKFPHAFEGGMTLGKDGAREGVIDIASSFGV